MTKMSVRAGYALCAIAAAGLAFGATAKPAAAVDFSGKRIEFLIPFGSGGGSDRWARFYAPRLSKALPGNPVIAVKNMPGGGSTKGANYYQARGKTDGMMIFGSSGSTQFPYLLGDKRVKYEYKDWTVILATPTGGVAYLQPSLGVKSAADLKKLKGRQLKYGSQGATSLDLVPLLAFELLGLDVQAVFGMKGRGPARLAFERGETTIDYQTTAAYLKRVMPLVKDGKAVPFMSWGSLDDNGNLVRDPTFPNLPHFGEVYEMVHGKKPSGPAWNAWLAFFTAGFPAQKMIFLRKGTPKGIVDTYRKAVKDVLAVPGFAKAAQKTLGDYPQAIGAKADKLYSLATTVDPKAREWVRNWLMKKYNVQF